MGILGVTDICLALYLIGALSSTEVPESEEMFRSLFALLMVTYWYSDYLALDYFVGRLSEPPRVRDYVHLLTVLMFGWLAVVGHALLGRAWRSQQPEKPRAPRDPVVSGEDSRGLQSPGSQSYRLWKPVGRAIYYSVAAMLFAPILLFTAPVLLHGASPGMTQVIVHWALLGTLLLFALWGVQATGSVWHCVVSQRSLRWMWICIVIFAPLVGTFVYFNQVCGSKE